MRAWKTFATAVLIGCLAASRQIPRSSAQTVTPIPRPVDEPPPEQRGGQGEAVISDGPQGLLERAIINLERHRSVAAKIRQRMEFFGREPVVGSGTYLEQKTDEGLQLRFEVRYQVGEKPCTLLQVCDRRYLWFFEQFGEKTTLGRVDMAQVGQALENKGDSFKPGKIGAWPGLGGLPKLLRGLNASFEFISAAADFQLTGQFPAIRLEGRWKREKLAAMLPAQQAAILAGKAADLEMLPRQVPHSVVLYLGKADGFPCRIEYHRHEPGDKNSQAEDHEIATMELFETCLDIPIPAGRFLYDPTIEFSDQTDRFMGTLGLKSK